MTEIERANARFVNVDRIMGVVSVSNVLTTRRHDEIRVWVGRPGDEPHTEDHLATVPTSRGTEVRWVTGSEGRLWDRDNPTYIIPDEETARRLHDALGRLLGDD